MPAPLERLKHLRQDDHKIARQYLRIVTSYHCTWCGFLNARMFLGKFFQAQVSHMNCAPRLG